MSPAFAFKLGLALLISCASFAPTTMAQHMNADDAPCRGIAVTSDLAQCFWEADQKADKKLNETYGKIMKFLDGRQRTDDNDALRKAQRLWIEYRDANCAAASGLYGEGTGGPVTRLACLEFATRQRIEDLKKGYGSFLEGVGEPL